MITVTILTIKFVRKRERICFASLRNHNISNIFIAHRIIIRLELYLRYNKVTRFSYKINNKTYLSYTIAQLLVV